jgi:antitoxin (DNA-binding transcriptional repressor) of toxin-antitoxin stability system
VLVTDRGRVVAELVPPRGDLGGPLADELLADAIRQGWLTPRRSPGDRALPRRPVAPLARLLAELAADRSDR